MRTVMVVHVLSVAIGAGGLYAVRMRRRLAPVDSRTARLSDGSVSLYQRASNPRSRASRARVKPVSLAESWQGRPPGDHVRRNKSHISAWRAFASFSRLTRATFRSPLSAELT